MGISKAKPFQLKSLPVVLAAIILALVTGTICGANPNRHCTVYDTKRIALPDTENAKTMIAYIDDDDDQGASIAGDDSESVGQAEVPAGGSDGDASEIVSGGSDNTNVNYMGGDPDNDE